MSHETDRAAALADRGFKVIQPGSDNPAGSPASPAQPQSTVVTEPSQGQAQQGTPQQAAAQPQATPQEPAPGAPQGEPAKPGTAQEPIVFDEAKWLEQRFGGKFKSADEVNQALSAMEGMIRPSNEVVKGLNEFVDKGGSIEEYLKTQLADFSKMSHIDVLRAKIKFEKPFLTDTQIDLKLKSEYKIGEEGEFEEPYYQVKLTEDGEEARKFMVGIQKEHAVPSAERAAQAREAEYKANLQKWEAQVDTSLTSFTGLKFEYGDEKNPRTFEFKPDTQTMAQVREIMNDPTKLWEKFKTTDELRDAIFHLLKRDTITKSMANSAMSAATEQTLTQIENPANRPGGPVETAPVLTPIEQARQQVAQRRGWTP